MLQSFQRLVAAGAALAALSSAVAVPESGLQTRQTSATCATGVHMIVAGGCAEPCVSSKLGYLYTLVNNVTAAFPGSDYYLIPYDGSEYQAKASTPVMIAAAEDYVTSCPSTPIVFIGYSLGGIVVMNSLCSGQLDSLFSHVLGAITYGEETFRYPLAYDAGTCTNSAPLFPRNATAGCQAFAPAIQSYCDLADPKCCTGGLNPFAHFEYDNAYDVIATDFLLSRLATYNVTTSSSSVAASTSTSVSSILAISSSILATTTSTVTTSSTTILPTSTSTSTIVVLTTVAPSTTTTVDPPAVSTTTVSTTVPVVPVSATTPDSTTVITSSVEVPVTSVVTISTPVSVTAVISDSTTVVVSTAVIVSTSVGMTMVPTVITSGVATLPASAATTSYFMVPSGSSTVENPVPNSAILDSSSAVVSIISSGQASQSEAVVSATSAAMGSGTVVASATGTMGGVASLTIGNPTASVTPYTGAASTLVMPGLLYIQLLCKAYRSLASLMVI